MREHQIAINLKAQQFELLQKLARERGFKSVTAYVKQKIVELALGFDEDASAVDDQSGFSRRSGGESQALLEDLSRIHGDLKAFLGQDGQAVAQANLAGNQAAGSVSANLSRDNDQAFDLPPPGQPLVSPYASSADSPALSPGSSGQSSSSSVSSSSTSGATFGSPSSAEASAPVSSQVLPSNNLGGFGFRLGGYAAASSMNRYQPPVENNADRLAGYREVMDDLEELADRAFAISPRLGALDEDAAPETATARGVRSESILVEPILPSAGAAHSFSGAHPKSEAPMAPPVPAAPRPAPVNIVKPFSAAELPGPGEMAAATPAPAAPAPAPAPAPEPLSEAHPDAKAEVPLTHAPAPAQPSEPASQLASETVPDSQQPSILQDQAAQQQAATVPSSAPVAEPLPLPLPLPPPPEDDLLSELLDESLVAHAHAPRPADSPFAVAVPGGFDAVAVGGAVATDFSAEDDDLNGSAVADPVEEEIAVTAPGALPVTQAEALALRLPAASQAIFDAAATGDRIEALAPSSNSYTNSYSDSYSDSAANSYSDTDADREEQLQKQIPSGNQSQSADSQVSQSQSGNHSQASQSQTGPQPGVSGGPPPKRRRT